MLDPLEELTAERFRLGFEVDVFGTLAITQAARAAAGAAGPSSTWSPRAGAARRSGAPVDLALTGRADRAHAQPGGGPRAGDRRARAGAHITPAGGVGRLAAPALGIEFGDGFLTAEQVGDAVVRLAGERESALWTVDAAQLSMVTSVPIGV